MSNQDLYQDDTSLDEEPIQPENSNFERADVQSTSTVLLQSFFDYDAVQVRGETMHGTVRSSTTSPDRPTEPRLVQRQRISEDQLKRRLWAKYQEQKRKWLESGEDPHEVSERLARQFSESIEDTERWEKIIDEPY